MSRRHLIKIDKGPALKGMVAEMSSALAKEFKFKNGDEAVISFGTLSSEVTISIKDSGVDRRIVFSPKLLSELRCPSGLSLHVRRPKEREIHIGPLLGIFAPRYGIGRFGAHTPYIRQLVRYARRLGMLAYVFSPSDIDFDNKTSLGYVLKEGRWRKVRFPLPDVVYDRVPSRRIEAQSRIKKAKNKIREMNEIECFNDRFMDKWRVHRSLSDNDTAAKYLPKTKRYEGQADLQSFLSKFKKVYIKPTGGSQGHGIIKVARLGGERFSYVVSGRGAGSCVGYRALAARLSKIIGNKRYIIQQGLHLATVGGRHFDIRLLMQKDSTGNWLTTKIYTRVAAAGRITSNISTGAEGLPMGPVLRRSFGAKGKVIAVKVRAAGRKLAPIIEESLKQNFGELGLDIGVDVKGHVWLIEVNSKPFRHMTTEKGSKLAIIRSVVRPLSYTLGLSGFHKMRRQPVEDGDDQYDVGN